MTAPTPEDLRERFNYHRPPNDQVVRAHELIRNACLYAAMSVAELCPDGREKALAITKLEEAMMWGNAAIARNHEATTNRFKTGSDDKQG